MDLFKFYSNTLVHMTIMVYCFIEALTSAVMGCIGYEDVNNVSPSPNRLRLWYYGWEINGLGLFWRSDDVSFL